MYVIGYSNGVSYSVGVTIVAASYDCKEYQLSYQKLETYNKIRLIRYEEGLNRNEFSKVINVSSKTIEGIENKGIDPKTSHVQSICKAFPEYTLWMMIDAIDLQSGQISPPIKSIMKENYYLIVPDGPFIFDRLMKDKLFVFNMKRALKKYCKNNHNKLEDITYPSSVFHRLNIKK